MAAPRRWRSLRWKLFLSYLAVLIVGSVTLLVAVNLLAPTLFAGHFVRLLGPGGHPRPWWPWWRFPGQLAPDFSPDDPFSGIPGIAFGLALRQALLLAGLVGAVTAVGDAPSRRQPVPTAAFRHAAIAPPVESCTPFPRPAARGATVRSTAGAARRPNGDRVGR